MLEGCVPWPDEVARRYTAGWRVGSHHRRGDGRLRVARNHPDKTAVIHGDCPDHVPGTRAGAHKPWLTDCSASGSSRSTAQSFNCPTFPSS